MNNPELTHHLVYCDYGQDLFTRISHSFGHQCHNVAETFKRLSLGRSRQVMGKLALRMMKPASYDPSLIGLPVWLHVLLLNPLSLVMVLDKEPTELPDQVFSPLKVYA